MGVNRCKYFSTNGPWSPPNALRLFVLLSSPCGVDGEVTSDQLRSCSWEIRWLDIYRDLAISLNYFSLLKLTFHCIYK